MESETFNGSMGLEAVRQLGLTDIREAQKSGVTAYYTLRVPRPMLSQAESCQAEEAEDGCQGKEAEIKCKVVVSASINDCNRSAETVAVAMCERQRAKTVCDLRDSPAQAIALIDSSDELYC